MTRLLLIGVILMSLGGCSNPQTDLKSPCVGTDDSPCVRRPVNNEWMHIPDEA